MRLFHSVCVDYLLLLYFQLFISLHVELVLTRNYWLEYKIALSTRLRIVGCFSASITNLLAFPVRLKHSINVSSVE